MAEKKKKTPETVNIIPILGKLFEQLKTSKKIPLRSNGEKKFVISCAKKRSRQVTFFGMENSPKAAFDSTAKLAAKSFTKTMPEWFFCGLITQETMIPLEEFLTKLHNGFSDWDGVSFDRFYNLAFLKQDLTNVNLVFNDGKKLHLNNDELTNHFRRVGKMPDDLFFTSENIKYVTIFKIDGFCHFNRKIIEYNSTSKAENLPFSLQNFVLNNKSESFKTKLHKLTEKIKSNSEVLEKVEKLEKKVIFISVSDGKERANILSGMGFTFKYALETAVEKAENYVSAFGINPVWVKVDVIIENELWSKEKFVSTLNNPEDSSFCKHGNPGAYFCEKGIAFDSDFTYFLLSPEINTTGVWDFTKREFDLNKINENLARKGLGVIPFILPKFNVFKCFGVFSDENNQEFDLRLTEPNSDYYGRRVTPPLSKEDVAEMVKKSVEFLLYIQKPDGSYTYGMYASSNKILNSYNIIRHVTTSLSILQFDELTGKKDTSQADLSNDYALQFLKYKNADTAFLFDETAGEFKLGANAVTVIAFATYSDFFPTTKYNEQIRVLANGILEMQHEDGSFEHVWNEDFSLKEITRTVYYDGEAVYGLIRAYDMLGDKKYLDAAEKSVNYFIANHYEKYVDHWVAYSFNHITKHLPKQEYFDFALLNAGSNLKRIRERRTPFHTYLELLTQTFTLYKRIEEFNLSGSDIKIPKYFNVKELAETILYRIEYMANSYIYPEFAMYMKEPQKTVYTFAVRHWDWRIRIDDLGHFIGAFYEFLKRYDDIIAAATTTTE